MNDRHAGDRDEFERILERARLRRAAYLGEAIAVAAAAIRKRVAALFSTRIERGIPATR